jgi:hypothetical protein
MKSIVTFSYVGRYRGPAKGRPARDAVFLVLAACLPFLGRTAAPSPFPPPRRFSPLARPPGYGTWRRPPCPAGPTAGPRPGPRFLFNVFIVPHEPPSLTGPPRLRPILSCMTASVQVNAGVPGHGGPPRAGLPVRPGRAAVHRRARSAAPGPGAGLCYGSGTELAVAGSNPAAVPPAAGREGMRNGNVPRRSPHSLEVFPCVQ